MITLKKTLIIPFFLVANRTAFNSGINLELDLILIPGIGMGMGINF